MMGVGSSENLLQNKVLKSLRILHYCLCLFRFSQLKAFETLLLIVVAALKLEPVWGEISRPSCGIFMSLKSIWIPWPEAIAQMVHSELSHFTRRRPFRTAGDFSRPWR